MNEDDKHSLNSVFDLSDPDALLLGNRTPYVSHYAPQLLQPIPRAPGRAVLEISGVVPFAGVDVWHAYELSWLDAQGQPHVAVGRFVVPADSPRLIESKSLKLYLNSLNLTEFADLKVLLETLSRDLSAACGSTVDVEVQPLGTLDEAGWSLGKPGGKCLDELTVRCDARDPAQASSQLRTAERGETVSERWFTHCFRSCCPVTGQPDWATVVVSYRGAAIEPHSLLRYLAAYREHAGFHEHCVERIYVDIQRACQPDYLHVQAHFLRRGGIDINPLRSSNYQREIPCRLHRQ